MKRNIILIIVSLVLLCTMTILVTAGDDKTDKTKNEIKTIKVEPKIFEGYIVDKECGTRGVGLDGSDVLRNPEDHTLECVILCMPTGLGLSIQSGKIFKFVPFDTKGNELAKKILSTKRFRALFVQVEGALKDNVLSVTSIKEVEPK